MSCEGVSKLPWKFACTMNFKQYEYEEGFPHTREDIIFLSSKIINNHIAVYEEDENLTSTLIHEKIHIFQRKNPHIMNNFLKDQGYKECNIKIENKRSNPDIDDKIYRSPASKECMYFNYRSSTPTKINDVFQSNHSEEHPYEKMAYDIANEYSLKDMRKYKSI